MIELRIRTNLPELRAVLAKGPERLRRAIVRGLNRAGEVVTKAAQKNLTRNRSVASGQLRASMGWAVDQARLRAAVGPGLAAKATGRGDVNYGFWVEHGRRPGLPPPVRALRQWASRRAGADPRLAYAIAASIAIKGTRPAPFLVPALQDSASAVQAVFEKELRRELDAIDRDGGRAR